jgi:hypothetical protein
MKMAKKFCEITKLGISCLKGKETTKPNIVEVLKLITYFLGMVNEDVNEMLLEVSKEELKEILESFQKDKSLGLDGWKMECFLGFYEMIEEDLLRVVEETK